MNHGIMNQELQIQKINQKILRKFADWQKYYAAQSTARYRIATESTM